MTIMDLFLAQITDPFRIGLLIALLFTTRNTRATTGVFVPLLAGMVFVAVLIPMTVTRSAAPMAEQVGVGLASNAVILAVLLAIWTVINRFRQKP